MKNKSLKIVLTVMLLASVTGLSGCENVVESAVVAEEGTKTGSNGEADGDSAESADAAESGTAAEKSSASQKTVKEQVSAPETYTAALNADLTGADRTDKETPMKFTLTASDAPVEVPDADKICLKKAENTGGSGDDMKKTFEGFIRTLSEGQAVTEKTDTTSEDSEEISYTGQIGDAANHIYLAAVNGIPYEYNVYLPGTAETGASSFYAMIDQTSLGELASDQGYGEDTGSYLSALLNQAGSTEAVTTDEDVLSYLDKLGLSSSDYRIAGKDGQNMPWHGADGVDEYTYYNFERIIDGIPVTYVNENKIPVYEKLVTYEDENGNMVEAEDTGWFDEHLTLEFASGKIYAFSYTNDTRITDASDEALFLLPFEEIRSIFEKTITLQVMTEEDTYKLSVINGMADYRYPSVNSKSCEMTITKVKLGYMRVRDDGSATEGTLIPVWDFFGTWTAEEPDEENGGFVTNTMTWDNVPMLTIDARDGSIITRKEGL